MSNVRATLRAGLAAGAVGGLLAVTMLSAQQASDTPVFRAESSGVTVDVSVKRGNRPVVGLTADDFVVIDNGVPQKVEQVSFDVMPIDLTLVLDRSGSTANILGYVQRNATRVAGMLRPVDRVRILALDSEVHEILPQQAAGGPLVLREPLQTGGMSSVRDALVAALITRPDPERRRLVVAMTDGADTRSIASAETLVKVVRQSDVVLYVIGLHSLSERQEPAPARSRLMAVMPDFFARPPMTKVEWQMFETLAALSGGEFHGPTHDAKHRTAVDPVKELRTVFDDFRQRYFLHFQPDGVAEEGWHELTVKVKGVDAKGVRARKGYFRR